jgi:hypothetical protein
MLPSDVESLEPAREPPHQAEVAAPGPASAPEPAPGRAASIDDREPAWVREFAELLGQYLPLV